MKVLYLNASGQIGGAENSLLDVIASIHAAQPAWSLHLLTSEDGPLVVKARALGVQVKVLPFPAALTRLGDAGAGGPAGAQVGGLQLLLNLLRAAPGAASYLRELRREVQRLSPDIMHANSLKMHILSVWARPRRPPAVVWHVHDYISVRPVMARLMRRYASRCAAAVANSYSVARDVRAVCGDSTKVHAVHNAVDLDVFTPDGPRLDLDSLSGLSQAEPGTVRVGMLATMARWKGHETFLRSLSLLPDELPARGYIIGGAIYRTDGSQYVPDELRSLARRLGVQHKVGFTGYVDNAPAAIRSLDIVVHASTQPEPFGLVIAEGMACGRSVIASHAGGAAELIQVGEDALAHAPGDARALSRNIRRLIEAPHLRARLGRAGRETARRRFDRARLAANLIPIYLGAAKAAD
jgi:glycosyltransferase involved in cell wall biosynthesis